MMDSDGPAPHLMRILAREWQPLLRFLRRYRPSQGPEGVKLEGTGNAAGLTPLPSLTP